MACCLVARTRRWWRIPIDSRTWYCDQTKSMNVIVRARMIITRTMTFDPERLLCAKTSGERGGARMTLLRLAQPPPPPLAASPVVTIRVNTKQNDIIFLVSATILFTVWGLPRTFTSWQVFHGGEQDECAGGVRGRAARWHRLDEDHAREHLKGVNEHYGREQTRLSRHMSRHMSRHTVFLESNSCTIDYTCS